MKIVNWLAILVLVLGITQVGTAQGNKTALTGTILDTTGARVSGATVIAVNTDTNASRATITSGAGSFYIGNLSIGNYRLVASAPNFSKKQVSDILLSSGQTRTLDVRLDIERVAEEINVIDEAPALAATTAEIGSVVQAQQIKDLPLNGRNIASVLALVPGAIDSGGGSLSSIRFAGRGNDDTNFRLDGIDASGIRAQNPSTTLRLQNSTESIAEVKVSAPSTYSLIDNLTETYGRHTIKAGIELKEVHFNYSQAGVHQLQYNGYTQFLTNKLDSVSVVADVPVHGLHKMESFGYAQDTFKMRQNLTFTLGMRYEFFNVLNEVHGRSQAWDDETCGQTAQCPVGGQFTIPVTTNFEPRFSFGWEPAIAKGKTVVRGGAGVYHGEAQLGDLNAPSDNFTTLFGLTPAAFPGLSWPVDSFVAQAALNPQAVQPRGLQRDRLDPRVTQYGLQIQTALPYRFILDTGYIASWGDHQFYRTYRNNYLYGTTIRPYPGFGQVDYKEAVGTTNFNAWQASLQRQFRNGLSAQFNYMYCRAQIHGRSTSRIS